MAVSWPTEICVYPTDAVSSRGSISGRVSHKQRTCGLRGAEDVSGIEILNAPEVESRARGSSACIDILSSL
jgi:hypothetical protein